MQQIHKNAKIIWLTGISGAGKSTLAKQIVETMLAQNIAVQLLDGDEVRNFFEGDLGYSRKERILNVRRIAFAAFLLAQHGINVVVSNIAPYYEVRDFVREKLKNQYIQVYVKTSIETAIKRDVHGHYKKFKTGEMSNIIGLDDNYDIPRNPNLIVDTNIESVEESFKKILTLLKEKGITKC